MGLLTMNELGGLGGGDVWIENSDGSNRRKVPYSSVPYGAWFRLTTQRHSVPLSRLTPRDVAAIGDPWLRQAFYAWRHSRHMHELAAASLPLPRDPYRGLSFAERLSRAAAEPTSPSRRYSAGGFRAPTFRTLEEAGFNREDCRKYGFFDRRVGADQVRLLFQVTGSMEGAAKRLGVSLGVVQQVLKSGGTVFWGAPYKRHSLADLDHLLSSLERHSREWWGVVCERMSRLEARGRGVVSPTPWVPAPRPRPKPLVRAGYTAPIDTSRLASWQRVAGRGLEIRPWSPTGAQLQPAPTIPAGGVVRGLVRGAPTGLAPRSGTSTFTRPG